MSLLPDSTLVETTAEHFDAVQTYVTTLQDVRNRGDLTVQRVLLTIPPVVPVIPERHPDADLIDDLANDLRRAWDATSGLARYPMSDPVWPELARVAIERVRAAR